MATLGRDMLNASDPSLKMAWVERGNPLTQSPDSNMVREAFNKLEFKVVVEQFMTDTAQMADIILPAKSMFEQTDVIGSYWSPYIQLKPKVLDPPGEVMTEPEYYYHLASLMGIDNSNWKMLPPPGDSSIIRWLGERMKSYPDVTLEMLSKGPLIAPKTEEIAYKGLNFLTPSRKAELVSTSFTDRWGLNDTPSYTPPDRGAAGDERFPLWFISPNTGSRIHSQFGNLSVIRESVPEPLIEISPADALARGISDGDTVRVFNLNGEVINRCRITNRLSAGCVVLPNGIWLAEGGAGNRLTAGRETDMGHGASFHDTRIEMELYIADGR